ncbi:MAG: hypothetical protein CVV64_06310 [Candidatus Wallbacteria bacterium HGW-Wallbacteria-1]|jgi:flagellar basal body-associated protein FliL|uniref:Flagellar protein FliL n=1 Tax=Candidatus Wallbacteria bacterium HGW-Wallbacteria-1 TaxID=2013854 RepID=A0A2N1PSQ2_9BACT|nr:MAG: hypothetical protein CVV64_06310 [Candidatus Wallbacteria bacterium HGW-Wallbacteria-1]
MADEDREQLKGGNSVVKYLVIGIIVVINILLVSGVSLFVFNSLRSSAPAVAEDAKSDEEPRKVEKAVLDVPDEFRIPTRDGGMIMLKLALGLSTTGTQTVLEANIPKVYDAINTFFIKRDRKQIQDDFIKTGKNRLHSQLARDINIALKNELSVEKSFFSDNKKQEVVNVYFKSYLTVASQ